MIFSVTAIHHIGDRQRKAHLTFLTAKNKDEALIKAEKKKDECNRLYVTEGFLTIDQVSPADEDGVVIILNNRG